VDVAASPAAVPAEIEIQEITLALRAGFAAASLLGVVTSFGTTLWLGAVIVLVALVFGLAAAEGFPVLRRRVRE
jgi:hypothetical protein